MSTTYYRHPKQNHFRYNYIDIALFLYTVPATIKVRFIWWNKLFFFLLIFFTIQSCQPSCHNCLQLANIFKPVATKRWLSLGDEFPWYNCSQFRLFIQEILRHLNCLLKDCRIFKSLKQISSQGNFRYNLLLLLTWRDYLNNKRSCEMKLRMQNVGWWMI